MALAEKIYKGDIGTVISATIDTTEDISSGDLSFKVQKPDGSTAEWTAVYALVGTDKTMKHTIISGELDVAGTYKVQPYIDVTSWIGRGNTFNVVVHDYFK